MLLSAQPPFDGALDGEFLGHGSVYCGDGVQWFVSDAPQQVDYKDYCKSSYRPGNFPALLTSERLSSNGKSAVWHDAPMPLPHELQEPHNATSVRFKMAGGVVERMPWLQLDGQLFELNESSTKIIKHFLGGRVSLLIEQLKWSGPWQAMMDRATRARYTDLFKKMDVDNSGTVDGGELQWACEQLGLELRCERPKAMPALSTSRRERNNCLPFL